MFLLILFMIACEIGMVAILIYWFVTDILEEKRRAKRWRQYLKDLK